MRGFFSSPDTWQSDRARWEMFEYHLSRNADSPSCGAKEPPRRANIYACWQSPALDVLTFSDQKRKVYYSSQFYKEHFESSAVIFKEDTSMNTVLTKPDIYSSRNSLVRVGSFWGKPVILHCVSCSASTGKFTLLFYATSHVFKLVQVCLCKHAVFCFGGL